MLLKTIVMQQTTSNNITFQIQTDNGTNTDHTNFFFDRQTKISAKKNMQYPMV